MYFFSPVSCQRGSLDFYLCGYQLGIFDADGGDKVTDVKIFGKNYDGETELHHDETDREDPTLVSEAFDAIDCSSYRQLAAVVTLSVTTTTDIELTHLSLRGYYAA